MGTEYRGIPKHPHQTLRGARHSHMGMNLERTAFGADVLAIVAGH